ncbi:hypothetical protein WMY93_002866 [Mugilogobius chulae]|uniref:Uncharacterized protein n=1 Tax=Mugilogobius chulae TaxID=88201 RepID=A0AAW0PWQ3_9GOBI
MDLLEVIQSHVLLSSVAFLVVTFFTLRFIRDSFKVDQLYRRHVLITGCDSGFGNLLARQLDAKGVPVIAGCLTEKGAEDLSASTSSRLKTVLLNVTDGVSIKKAVEFVRAEVGQRGLWGLVNNAGISIPIVSATLKKGKGRVVNVASILGRLSLTGGGYCISKYGVEAFSDSLRMNMEPFGLKVSIIEPGFFKTAVTNPKMIENDLERLWTRLPQNSRTPMAQHTKAQNFSLGILCSADLSKVTKCMEHALTAYYPRTRYGAGWDAKFFWIPLSYLPSFVSDFVVKILLPTPKSP